MEYALIKAGRVEQIIVADAEFLPVIQADWDHITPADGKCAIGWTWNGAFVPPPTPEPEAD